MGVGKFRQVSRSEISLRVKGDRPNSLRNDTRSPGIELQAAAVYTGGNRVDFFIRMLVYLLYMRNRVTSVSM